MATIIWGGKSGNWNAGTLWTGTIVPGASDIAEIDVSTGTDTILLNDSRSAGGVTLNGTNATLQVAGTLNLGASGVLNAQAGTLLVSGTLLGGTLEPNGATIQFPSTDPVTKAVASPELDNVSVAGTLDISASPVTLQAIGLGRPSLTNIKIGAGSEILVLDGEIFSNQAIDLAGGVLAADGADPNDGSIFIGPGSTLIQNTPSTTARVGPDLTSALLGLGRLTSQGTIIASAGTLLLDAEGGAFSSPFKQGPFTNTGTIQISGGATVVDDTNSTFAGLGTITNTGGLLDLRGTLDNTGATIDVGTVGAFTNLQLDDTVTGGTIIEDGGSLAVGAASLQGVTLSGTGMVFSTLTIGKGTTFNPSGGAFTLTANQNAYGQIFLNDGAVLSNARIVYGGTQFQANITLTGAAAPTATLDATTTLDVGAGQILRLDATPTGTLVNNAVINVAAGGRLELDNAATYVPGGAINVVPGATVTLGGNIGLAALSDVVGTGATLIGAGTLDLLGGTISTTGNANFSKFQNVNVITNGTLVTAAGQSPDFGSLLNASLVLAPGVTPVDQFTVNNVTIQGAMHLAANGVLEVFGDLNMENSDGTGPGTIILDEQPQIFVLGSATSIQFRKSMTLSNAVVLMSGVTPATALGAFNAQSDLEVQGFETVTLAPSTEIVATTVNGPIGILGGPGFFLNKGTIAVTPGADLLLGSYGSATVDDFVNKGLVTIAAGGTLDVQTHTSISSLGSIVGPGGLLRIGTPDIGTNNYDNSGNTLVVGGPSGAPDLEINNTAITGGTIVNAGGNFTAINGGKLNTVTYVGPLHLTNGTDIFGNTASGNLIFNGGTLNSQNVTIDAGAQLLLGGNQNFVGATLSLAGELADTGAANTLSFDSATTVNITGSVFMPVGHLLNAGTINVGAGGNLSLSDFSALATPEPTTVGTIVLNGGTFSASVLSSGQTVDLGPNSTLSISNRFDPGSEVVFQAPNTLNIAQSVTADPSIAGFGVGDTIALTGYQDGSIAQSIFGNNGIPHGADATITLGYDGNTLTVTRGGTLAIASLAVGAGYDINGFTVTPVGTPPILVTGYNIAYAPPGVPPPALPGISGTGTLATDDLTAVAPFANVVLTDVNIGAVVTALVSHPFSAGGTFTAPAGGTLTSGGSVWSDTGSPDAVQAALRALVVNPTPHQTAPGQTVTTNFTIALNDQFGTVTDKTTSVVTTAVDDPILLSGVTPVLFSNSNVNFAQPFHQIVVSDPDNAIFTATATLSDSTYASFGKSFNATIAANGVYSASGNLALVTQSLHDLIAYTTNPPIPTGQSVTTTITMVISDGVSQTATATSTVNIVASGTADAAGLNIVGTTPGQQTTDQIAVTPFTSVLVTDKKAGVLDTVTITMSDPADGTLSDAAGGVISNGTFTTSATVDSTGFTSGLFAPLAGLTFTPTRGQVPLGQSVTTVFTIVASNSFGTVTDASTSVIATSAQGQMSIDGAQANQQFTDKVNALPLSGVTIFDTQASPVETAAVTLSNPSSGALTAGNGGTVGADGVFRVNGPLASVQAALQAVGFTPAAQGAGKIATSGITISVADGTLNATDTKTSLVIVGSGAAGTITPAPAAAALTSSGPALTAGTVTNSFVLNLGTVLVGITSAPVTLNALNTATGTADALSGTFSINDPGGFINSGFAGFATLAAGGTVTAGTIALATGTAGTFSETITLSPTDLNGGSGSALANETVTVQAVVVPIAPVSAIEVLNSGGTVVLPNVRVGSVDRQAVSISNGAIPPADSLTVTPVATGQATASGTISGLAAGATDATSILVGIDTSAVGARGGTVTLSGASVDSGGTAIPFPVSGSVLVSGTVYRTASGTIAPVASIVHVGDPGTIALTVANTAATDGFSENLIANVATVPAGFSVGAGGPTSDITAGTSDTATLRVGFSTASAGTIAGTVTVGLTSDGGSGPGSLDGLGTLALAAASAPVSVTVNNFANPAFENFANVGTLSGSGTAFALDLGTITQGTGPFTAGIDVRNLVSGPADVLTGSLTASGSGAFTNSGLASIGTLAAGATDIAPTITLATGAPGRFSENITLTPTGSNSGGFSAVLPAETLTVTGTVVAPPVPPAVEVLNSPGTIVLPNVRVGAVDQQAVSLSNGATATTSTLSVTPSASGLATASGTVSGLAAGATDATSILLGIDTTAAGTRGGSVTLNGSSVDTGGTATALGGPPVVAVSGNVYRAASGTIAPVATIVHVGDPGTLPLNVANTATADGFSESLIATVATVPAGFSIAAGGPTGDIAAGASDAASLKLGFSTAAAGTIEGTVTVGMTSDGGTLDGLGTLALAAQGAPVSVTVNNLANPVFEKQSGAGTLTGGGTAFTLNLGTIVQGTGALTTGIDVRNLVAGPADVLTGSLSGAILPFINLGMGSIGTLAAGAADIAPAITLAAGPSATPGTFSETITLTPTGSNAGGFSATLPAETLTVTGTIVAPLIAPAIATIVGGNTIDFGNRHLGALTQQTLDIANTATAGSAALDASTSFVVDPVTATGTIAGLAPGSDDKTGIQIALNTGTAGVRSGTASLAFVSDGGTLGSASLPGQTVAVSGTVYREATAALLPLSEIVHVGDPGSIVLPIANSDPNDGFSERLIASLAGASGGLSIAGGGPTGAIAAGSTDTATLALAFSTASAGTIAGSATVGLVSDGGTGAGAIDGLGRTTLTSQTVPVSITVDNYAAPVLTSAGNLKATGANSFVLNLGTATVGAAALSAGLNIGNGASGAADLLNGTWSVSGSSQFSNAGLGAFGSLTAGGSLSAGTVTLATNQAGVFTETITLTPTGTNASSFSGILAADTITVVGTISPPTGSGTGDVHMLTFAGQRYDFQAIGGFVLARSTVPGDTFQVQIETAASWTIDAASVTTEAAARIGSHVVTFGVGRSDVVWLDGAPDTALTAGGAAQDLGSGWLRELSSNVFSLSWSAGETLTVTDRGPYLDDAVSLGPDARPGSAQGLLGSDSGQANDFQLADGTVLARPLGEAELVGAFANSWRVTPASSMLGDVPMQFLRGDQVVNEATAAGQTLSAGAGEAVLSDAGGFGTTFSGTLADLAGEAIEGFSRADAIDIAGLNSATARLAWSGLGDSGTLNVSDGVHSGDLRISGSLAGQTFHASSDQHGGVLIALS